MLSSVEAHIRRAAAIDAAVESAVLRVWSKVSPGAVASSWRALSSGALSVLVAGQLAAARQADAYVAAALDEQGVSENPAGSVAPAAFAGVASDGRSLSSLLDLPVTGAGGVLDLIGRGVDPGQALRSGAAQLGRIAVSEVQDAGRGAVGAAITARPRVGYVRVLTPPSCSRCVILAGRFYHWNTGFLRHRRCDCKHVPSTEADGPGLVTDPQAYVRSLSTTDQDRLLTKAGAQAYRDGADLNQLVNARAGRKPGLEVAGLPVTQVGTTRSGLAGQRLGTGKVRLMPEAIYQLASDRTEAVRLLKQHGFLI